MTELTTEIRSRHFSEYQRDRLYRELRESVKDKKDLCYANLKTYLNDNILGKVLNPDLVFLGSRSYCSRSTSQFQIDSEKFGLDKFYRGLPDFQQCKTGISFTFSSPNYRYALPSSSYSSDITLEVLSKCSESEIEMIKSSMYEYAKLEFEVDYFCVGTWVKPQPYSYCSLFPDIQTWGQLYNKSPEYFEVLYKFEEGKSTNEVVVAPEKKLVTELKTALGY